MGLVVTYFFAARRWARLGLLCWTSQARLWVGLPSKTNRDIALLNKAPAASAGVVALRVVINVRTTSTSSWATTGSRLKQAAATGPDWASETFQSLHDKPLTPGTASSACLAFRIAAYLAAVVSLASTVAVNRRLISTVTL